MPAFFSWIGGGSNLWENAADWDQNAVPTLADDVNISVANATVVNQQGAAAAHSILTDSSVHLVINDSLTLDAGGSIFGQLSVAGSLSLGSGLSYLSVGSLDLTGQVHLGAGAELALLPGASTLHTGAIIDGDGLVTNYGAVAMDGDATVNNLDHAGTLVGPGVLTITGTMNWQAGTLAKDAYNTPGTLDIAPAATLTIAGSTTLTIDGWTINDYGSINWTGGDVNNADSTVNIASGASFTITADGATWRDSLNDGNSTINNAGTLTKAGGMMGMPVTIEAALISSGDMDVSAGSMALHGGGIFSGALITAEDSDLTFGNGSFTVLEGAEGTGSGRYIIGQDGNTASVQVAAGTTVPMRNVLLRNGGTITGDGTFVFRGRSLWTGGAISGGLRRNEGVFTLAGNTLVQRGIGFENDGGLVYWTADFDGAGSDIRLNMEGTITNNGTWTNITVLGRTLGFMASPGAIQLVPPTFQNNGGLYLSGNGATVFDRSPFRNAGSVTVAGGNLNFSGPGMDFATSQGSYFEAHENATVRFEGGTYTFNNFLPQFARQMRGPGGFVAGSDAIIVVPRFDVIEADRFYLSGQDAVVRGAGEFNPHFMLWTNGRFDGQVGATGTTNLGAGDRLVLDGGGSENGTGSLTLGSRVINNQGTINWQPGARLITLQSGGTFNVDGGSFDIYNPTGEMRINPNQGQTGRFVIANNGTLHKLYTEENSEFATTFLNLPVTSTDGRIIAEGRVRFTDFTQTGEHASAYFGNRTYSFGSFVATDGSVTLEDGIINVAYPAPNSAFRMVLTQCTVAFNGAVRGNIRMESCHVDLTGNFDVLGASGQNEWLRCVGCTVNLAGNTLSVPAGGVNMDSPAGNRGRLNYQGGRIDARPRNVDFENVDVTGRGGNDGAMSLGTGSTLQISEVGSIGAFAVVGDMSVDATAILKFQISQNQNDQVSIDGHLNLSGSFDVSVIGTPPNLGAEFTLVQFGSMEGAFTNDTFDLGNGSYIELIYLETEIHARVASYI